MALHRLTHIVMGVPDVEPTVAYYTDFGLTPQREDEVSVFGLQTPAPVATHHLSTVDGGEQLRVVRTPTRRLVELGVGADDPDDLDRVARSLAALGLPVHRSGDSVSATDSGTAVTVRVEIADPYHQAATPEPPVNRPGNDRRLGDRAPGVVRKDRVRPRKLGHVVLGSTDQQRSEQFFTSGLGFKTSDTVPGLAAFLRCSTDHHNVLVQSTPVPLLHHTSWQVDDVDEVGRGATAMLEADPARHTWGLGRHAIGSNFFWYLKDPAGNFSEYYSDLDCIIDDALWEPGVWTGRNALWAWGPPPPDSFLAPEDLAELMTGAHGSR